LIFFKSGRGRIWPDLGLQIRPGPDMAGCENLAGFRPEPGPYMISGATLVITRPALSKPKSTKLA